MAHHGEPMDGDCIESDFDNKENTFQHSNVFPCTKKGYEELDVSQLNIKLRYSMTPASSPMSKSLTACIDKNLKTDDMLNGNQENTNLTWSLNMTMTKNDSIIKSLKSLPLQSIPTEMYVDGNSNSSVLRNKDSSLTGNANVTIVVSDRNDNDENFSLPSTSSSALHTPDATTPTKKIAKEGSSSIMRGLKSVLNMFRLSQSPIPPVEGEITVKQEVLSPPDVSRSENSEPQAVASTPIAANRTKDGNISKRSSPYKDGIVFIEDLEKELNWKDETTIIFSHEKIAVHKLFYPQPLRKHISKPTETAAQNSIVEDKFNSTVEYMDVFYKERSITEFQPDDVKNDFNVTVETDGEFVDCVTTFTKNESQLLDNDIKREDISLSIDQQKLDIQSSNNVITEEFTNETISNATTNLENPELKQVNDTTTEIAEPSEAVIKSKDNNESNNKKEQHSTSEEKSVEINDERESSIEFIPVVSSEVTTTSSSEHSTYFSAGGTSSTESSKSKNVFNLPEIDDVQFNPFATKSIMRLSPPPKEDSETENPFATRTKMMSSPDTSITVPSQLDPNSTFIIRETIPAQKVHDKTETELMKKETSIEMTNTTSSSGTTGNQNITYTREVHTEDEDTIEGPFLEAEDDDLEKATNFHTEDEDLMQMNDFPSQRVEKNMDDGELFIDAEAFEFLLNQKSNVVADSGKESLFLKFDPLFAKRISSDAVLAAMTKVQKKLSTPTKPARPSLKNDASPIAGPSNLNITYNCDYNNLSPESNDDVNITISKPMMVVTPAVNPAVTPRNKSITPTRPNRRCITFTSPAIAVIDRLLSMRGNSPRMGQDTTMNQADRHRNEADLALTQLKELLAEKEISVYYLRSESKQLKDRLAAMETQVRILEADGQDRLKKINELTERLAEKTKINKSMVAVVQEYERTITSLIFEIELEKKRNAEERIRLINERDEQTAHLASMEVSFSDLHSKYEKSKQVIFACKANKESYKKSLKEFEENLSKMHTNYEILKQHATSKLNHANQELEKISRAHEVEVVKLSAMIKKKDLHITSLEETLAQKTKANEELTAICDELLNKLG